MQYLTYDQYTEIGGVCELTAFDRYVDRACGIIDNATHNRIEMMAEIPKQAKALCRDLIEYLANNFTCNAVVLSKSQTAGAVSESESYAIKNKQEQTQDIDDMIFDYLCAVKNDNGVPLLYRGCAV